MKKVGTSMLLVLMILSATGAFAQVKLSPWSAKNVANLNRAISRATAPAIGCPVVTHLPAGLVPGNAVGLQSISMPRIVTPVNRSYIQYVHQVGKERLNLIAHNWMGPKGERALYDDVNQLARDVDAFYKGQADIYLGPDGRQVKLYMLPVDGLLYKLEGCKVPVVLNPQEYFIIYDLATQTGQIAQNTPQTHNLYNLYEPTALHRDLKNTYRKVKRAASTGKGLTHELDREIENVMRTFPEDPVTRSISQAVGGHTFSKVASRLPPLMGFVNVNDYSIYRLEKELGVQDRATGYWKEIWEKKLLPHVFDSQAQLGQALYRIHKRFGAVVENQVTEEVFRVYELPVTGLRILRNGASVELDGNKEVLLYKNEHNSILIDRETLENSNNFKFYNHYHLY